MIIRDANRGELPHLAAAVAPQPLLQRYQVTVERLQRDLERAADQGQLIVAEDQGAARGFAWYLPHGTFGAGGYLRLIALVPGHESRGLGRALLEEVERRVALKSRTLFLLVSHWNEDARRFYAGRGYSEVGRLPGFVRADTDEIICMKRV